MEDQINILKNRKKNQNFSNGEIIKKRPSLEMDKLIILLNIGKIKNSSNQKRIRKRSIEGGISTNLKKA